MKSSAFVFFFSIFLFSSYLKAQDLHVRNVSFTQQLESVFITYDLIGPQGAKAAVWVEVSDNYGRSYSLFPSAVSGHVGKDVLPGTGRQIRWNYLADFPDGLAGEGFVFAVHARLEKRRSALPWVLAGGGVIGGIVYWIVNGSKVVEEEKGVIHIRIPGEF